MKKLFSFRRCWLLGGFALLSVLFVIPFISRAQKDSAPAPFGKEWLKALQWRSIGPANMSGRITAISVYEKDPTIYYIATASGGLLKTSNNGVTFEHQFDHEKTVSIGDVAVSQTNPNIVWVGTGEGNPRNSVSYGDGVYKSTDGGKSWQNMGLTHTFQIGRILIHPTNPDTVYVGALGRLYGPNPQRGLFKTTDGGKTWKKILYVDENTGIIDMRMKPGDPDTLLVATYERRRDGFDFNDPAVKIAPGSGLYRTGDGGKSWKKVTQGLPTCKLGRIGLDWYRKDPKIVYMVLESEKIGKAPKGVKVGNGYMGVLGSDAKGGGAQLMRVVKGGPADKAGLRVGDLIVQFGKLKVKKYGDLLKGIRAHNSGDKVKVKVRRGKKTNVIKLTLGKRDIPNKDRPFGTRLGGQRENVQKKQGKDGYQYGGIYKSTDAGKSWQRINSLNPRPMYFSQIRVDPNDNKYLYVLGIALYRSKDGGKKFTSDGGRGCHPDHHSLWIDPKDGRHMILGNDGGFYVTYDRMANWDHINRFAMGQFYHVTVGPGPHYKVYGGLQDNGSWGGPAFTLNPRGPVNSDWVRVGGGDGFRCQVDQNDADLVYFESQNGNLMRRNFRTGKFGRIRPPQKKGVKYRWNWNTPFILSSHNSKIYYCAGNYVFKSLDRGNDLRTISPEITLTKKGSASALAESPKNPDLLYAGTDDGALWVTRDGGVKWINITEKVGIPGPRWVASIECSRFKEGRAYVVFDAHRSDDDEPYVYVTEDAGKTWKSLRANLPLGSTRVLREDLHNPNLLYLGTEFGVWFTLDRGESWHSLNTNLPTVAVQEFALHPLTGELIAGTHGRSLWVLDVTALRQLQPDTMTAKAHLYKPNVTIDWVSQPSRGSTNQQFFGENPPSGVQLYYSLPGKVDNLRLSIVDIEGKTLRVLKTANRPGLHRVTWDLRRRIEPKKNGGKQPSAKGKAGRGKIAKGKAAKGKTGRGRGGRGRGGRGRGFLRPVPAGTYRAVLYADGEEQSQLFRVVPDPNLPPSIAVEEGEEEFDMEEEHEEEEEGMIGD